MARHAGGPVCNLTRFISEMAGAVAYDHWARSARANTLPREFDVLAVDDEDSRAVGLDLSMARMP